MYDKELEYQWREEMTKRLANGKFSDLLGEIIKCFVGTEDLVWAHGIGGRHYKYDLLINRQHERHFDRNGIPFLEPSRSVLRERYLPLLNQCGVDISMDDVDDLLAYIDPSTEYHEALEGFYVWRMSWIVHAIERIAVSKSRHEINSLAFDLEQEVAALFDENNGNWWLLSTIATKTFDSMFIEWDYFYRHGNYAFDRGYLKAALALYRRVPTVAGRDAWEQHEYNVRCCLLNLYDNKPAYEDYFKVIDTNRMSPVCRDHLLCFRHYRRGEFAEAIRICEKHIPYVDWYSEQPMVYEYLFGYIHIDCCLHLGVKEKAMDCARMYWNNSNYMRTRLLDRLADSLVGMNMEDVAAYLAALLASEGEGRKSYREEWAHMSAIVSRSIGYDEEKARGIGEYTSDFRNYVLLGIS